MGAGSAPAVALLLHARADPDELDANGETPLHLACRQAPFQGGAAQGEAGFESH